jgi:hypothetical protein
MHKTARQIAREEAGGAPVFVLPVPFTDDRQMYYLHILTERGYLARLPAKWRQHSPRREYCSLSGAKLPRERASIRLRHGRDLSHECGTSDTDNIRAQDAT